MSVPEVVFTQAELQNQIGEFRKGVGRTPGVDSRFTLMSKLFARAQILPPGEERFLWLWIVLEVFPMKSTSDIRSICDHLEQVIGRSSSEIKSSLDVGRLFGARSQLVHDGKLPYPREKLGEVLKKLEYIDVAILRSVGGLPYNGILEAYFTR